MLPADLQLPFLEQRTYLHGTTLFDAMMRFVPEGAVVSFKIPRRIDSDRVHLAPAGGAGEASASMLWSRGGESATVVALAQPASGRPRRDPYDEAQVENRAQVQDKRALLREAPPYGLVQALIPLFKALLKCEVPTTTPGQWMFTRLDLSAQPRPFVPLELALSGVTPNALARARVNCAGAELGMLYFSWVKRD
jgi:hypothetical protein